MFRKRRGRGRGGYGARRQSRNGRPAPYSKRVGNKANNTNKVAVSNLDPEVTESDVKEIFQKIGRVTKALLNFDSDGRSRGTGIIIFANKNHAQKAVDDYDRAEVDGRPMYLKVVGDESKKESVKKQIVVKPVKKTVVKKTVVKTTPNRPFRRSVSRGRRSVRGRRTVSRGRRTVSRGRRTVSRGRRTSLFSSRRSVSRGRRSVRGRSVRGRRSTSLFAKSRRGSSRGRFSRGRGRSNRRSKPSKTVEQLDKELDRYLKQGQSEEKPDESLNHDLELYQKAGQPVPVAMDVEE